ncbi:MAG: hypothetical protein IKR17_00375 [Bacteroidales bacterium]|nr:hypothetical protein [Bacteroidales bacterium]
MKDFRKYILIFITSLSVAMGGVFTSCNDDDDYDTNQIKGGVSLTAAQLQLTRGGYMVFKGSGLNQIETIIFPDNVSVSNIEVVDQYTIRCIVPEDAVVGKVQLVYGGGSKVLETDEVAYTEPTTITDFSPKEVKPGDVLTITGTYLANTQLVSFNGYTTPVISATRTEVKVAVPIYAKTGKFIAGYNATLSDNTVSFTGVASNEEVKVVEPTITKISATTIKAGEKLTIEGTQLNQIATVAFNGASADSVKVENVYAELNSITVTVPTAATDGVVTLTSYAGVAYTTAAIKLTQPTVSIKDAKASYGVGEKVVIAGENLDLIASAAFNGDEAKNVTIAEDGTISLTVTEAAKSGDITFTLKNGTTITVSGFVTTKPVASDFPASATPLDKLSVTATLGNRVANVKFGDLEAAPEATATGFTVQVPLEATSGKVVGVMDNGEEFVLSESFTVNAYTFCAVKAFSSDNVTIGDLLKCTVVNQGNLTGVLLDGEETDYIINGNDLFVAVGVSTGKKTVTLVSGETKVDYTITVVGQGLVETVLWEGALEVKGWGGAWPEPQISLADVPSGALLRIRISGTPSSELQLLDQNWGQGKDWAIKDEAERNTIHISADNLAAGYADVDVSGWKDVDGLGVMFNADGVVVTAISYVIDYSAPTPVWEGNVSFDSEQWGVSMTAMQWGEWDKYKDNFQVGTKVTFYYTIFGAYTNIRIGNGSWVSLPSLKGTLGDAAEGNISLEAGSTELTITLTAEDVADLNSNGGLGVFGYGITLTKIAVK